MSANWPQVPLGEVLRKSEEWIAIDPDAKYSEVTVRLWGKGVTLRREVSGAEIAGSSRLCVRPNQFIASRIDARNGAFGLIPDYLDGAIVTNDFPVFGVAEERLDPRFLNWMSKTPVFVDLCKAASEGTTNRVRLKESLFLATAIPLPPLPEQQRILARVEAIAERIAEAQRRREEVRVEQAAFVSSLHIALAGVRCVMLSELLTLDEDRVPVSPDLSYPQVGINGFGGGLFSKEAVPGTATTYKHFNRLYSGAVVLSQVKGWEGAIGVCPEDFAGRFASPEYRTFRCRDGQADPKYLSTLFASPWFWGQLGRMTRGVGARRERVRPELFLSLELPFPTLDQQLRASKMFDGLGRARALQSETAAELDALLPSVLAKAFAGEL
jgi:type I restriction enzyme, S subunit